MHNTQSRLPVNDNDVITLGATIGTFEAVVFFFFIAAPRLNVPPRFRDTAFFDKGENVVVKIPFTGSPKPRITWQKDGETVESGGHFAVQVKVKYVFGLFYYK